MAACCILLALLVGMSGCGGGTDAKAGTDAKVALLLPEDETPRYESIDRPAFEERLDELCDDCEVIYRNAQGDVSKQEDQAEAVLSKDVDVLVFAPIAPEYGDTIIKRAAAQDIPIVNYDSLVFESTPDVLVSFDIVREGELMAEALAEKLTEMGKPRGPIVMINGEPGNVEQPKFEEGAEKEFAAAGVEIGRRDYTPFWYPDEARHEMEQAIDGLGAKGFSGVYAETDGLAEGSIEAMEAAGIDPTSKPTTGKDATIKGLQRILKGLQYMTLYEPIEREAATAAEIALTLAEGKDLSAETITDEVGEERFKVPAVLLEPVVVTKDNAQQVLKRVEALVR